MARWSVRSTSTTSAPRTCGAHRHLDPSGRPGRGVAQRALGIALRHARLALMLHSVHAEVHADHANGLALFEGAGFERVGHTFAGRARQTAGRTVLFQHMLPHPMSRRIVFILTSVLLAGGIAGGLHLTALGPNSIEQGVDSSWLRDNRWTAWWPNSTRRVASRIRIAEALPLVGGCTEPGTLKGGRYMILGIAQPFPRPPADVRTREAVTVRFTGGRNAQDLA